MEPERVEEIFHRFEEHNPHPTTELHYTNPYTLLVAVVLSAQSTDKGVNKATEKLFRVADTPEKMVALGIDGIKRYINTIGLYNSKAKHVYELSKILIDRYGGKVPADREALMALPGVGRKTANVVLNVAFHQPTIPVDTHVFRVARRLGLAHGNTPLKVEQELEHVIPDRYRDRAHHWLILHGRYVCKARKPACDRCFLIDLCDYAIRSGLVAQPSSSDTC
ncbi:MAG: endonuclease III [Alphaproteobacteria bacterium]|nr:MAG: endonuclease III [Alphaproteobacteria bacterium]